MSTFQYSPQIVERYPQVVGGIILAENLRNGPTPESLRENYQHEQERVKQQIGTTPLSQLPTLAGWRSTFRSFNLDPTQYRSAAEALLRRLTKKGDIPSINILVDIGNLVSIRYALPVAIIDTHALQGAVTVHFATGNERYTNLGEEKEEHPEPGEVVFTDETGLGIARRWCWRQSEQSAAQAGTTSAIIAIEAQHPNSRHTIQAALIDLQELLHKYAGGTYTVGIIDAEHPTISTERV
ncbi:B3/B4 domain-containing protein [Tengunoibacter tsumagoiensis]|uniref:B3/B4 tRNA-binding domain-containing protein n=1 Tax=Tengunoibacter tsumagoiensis TaxID=2014871 RepID=A0A401ZZI0_9CHLR|nr:phenylalanine--tRNA ligase beta subunit-related protein [Tengunoibacter tsumagoiensis]GCE12243.1 hypothetical protein KTT_21020 [Tengunoibacter tsumagoiensis]